MNSKWLQYTILRAASLLAPGDQRAGWVTEWQSELWYVPRSGATLFCLGAFRDALWLRRNNLSPAKRNLICLQSPLNCLALLATLAAVSVLIAVCLPAPTVMTPSPHLRARDLPAGLIAMLLYTSLLLPVTRLALGGPPTNHDPLPWPIRLRRGIFLALKIALMQPMMLCEFLVWILIARVAPFAPLGFAAMSILALRWAFTDQRSRCPVCLRLLTGQVRIGDPSHTFLEWYGAESVCSRGHGLLHVPEVAASYSDEAHWLNLDGSWRGLFSEVARARQR